MWIGIGAQESKYAFIQLPFTKNKLMIIQSNLLHGAERESLQVEAGHGGINKPNLQLSMLYFAIIPENNLLKRENTLITRSAKSVCLSVITVTPIAKPGQTQQS